MLHYCRSPAFGYGVSGSRAGRRKKSGDLTAALDKIAGDFEDLDGVIIDIRNNPGGDDAALQSPSSIGFAIAGEFAFHRKKKIGPGEDDFTSLKTWHIEPQGDAQFTGPIVNFLTCDELCFQRR